MTGFFGKDKGFSLIEILVSVSVLLIVLGALSSLAVGVVRTSSANKYQIEAYAQGQKQLEMAKQVRNSNNLDADPDTSWNTDQQGDAINRNNRYYYRKNLSTGDIELIFGQGSWSSTETGKKYNF